MLIGYGMHITVQQNNLVNRYVVWS